MLVKDNKLVGQIVVIPGKVEDVTVPEEVDTIISEPMGYMLFNERMLESFLHAKKWLKPGGMCQSPVDVFKHTPTHCSLPHLLSATPFISFKWVCF